MALCYLSPETFRDQSTARSAEDAGWAVPSDTSAGQRGGALSPQAGPSCWPGGETHSISFQLMACPVPLSPAGLLLTWAWGGDLAEKAR